MSASEALWRIGSASATFVLGLGATSAIDVNVTVPIFGASVVVIGAAATGAATSLAFGDPLESRFQLFAQTLAATVFGATFSVLAARGFHLQWAQELPGAFALGSAAIVRLFMPAVVARLKELIAKFELPKLGGIFKSKAKEDAAIVPPEKGDV